MKQHCSWISPQFARDFLHLCGNLSPNDTQIAFIKKSLNWLFINPTVFLSERERAFLFWIAQGYSFNEISITMKIKLTTTQTYSRRIKRKLGCKTLAQAVFISMRLETIAFENSEQEFIKFSNNKL